ncbi:MAG: hypothetical protein KDD51_00785 [Bdellovibrionales bacterium]|nr:hypothetical protein [Bdellovibrionales bacterium]
MKTFVFWAGVFCTLLSPYAHAKRLVDIMPAERLAELRQRFPRVFNPALQEILTSENTLWYDALSIIPGYQDSFGDNNQLPIGFRPNTIDHGLIDLAVPGGHAQAFVRKGQFHFPFGRVGMPDSPTNTFVVDFWRVPKQNGKPLPVVWWKREPNYITHRIEWMFPKGTLLGEILFMIDEKGVWYPFEIRTRIRELDTWTVDIYRPFPYADKLADALETKRLEKPEWRSSASLSSLISHLRNPNTLTPFTLSNTHFAGSFPAVKGAMDYIPALDDNSILKELLMDTVFESARFYSWKESGALKTFAPSTQAEFSIVPKNYDAGMFEVNEEFCNRCHKDAGRPFRDYYPNIIAYGELWGQDDAFSWHPFDNKNFVNSSGEVQNFNHDNRKFRQDLIDAGLLEKYSPNQHTAVTYHKLPGEWKDYAY